jgi:hypothetical protein
MMAQMTRTPVMDVTPWPSGHGFNGSEAWWDYVLSKDERSRIDNLIGVAMLDAKVSERLVRERDESLFRAFGLSEETRSWLRTVQANSLVELARAIVAVPQYGHSARG